MVIDAKLRHGWLAAKCFPPSTVHETVNSINFDHIKMFNKLVSEYTIYRYHCVGAHKTPNVVAFDIRHCDVLLAHAGHCGLMLSTRQQLY